MYGALSVAGSSFDLLSAPDQAVETRTLPTSNLSGGEGWGLAASRRLKMRQGELVRWDRPLVGGLMRRPTGEGTGGTATVLALARIFPLFF